MSESTYLHVAGKITEQVLDGEWAPGSVLPTVTELAVRHGVAQSTVLDALEELHRRALVAPLAGQRYVVRPRPPVQRLASHRFSSDRARHGLGGHFADFEGRAARISVHVERIEEVRDLPERARRLLGGDAAALVRQRRYFADDVPTQIATSYVPIAVAMRIPRLWQADTGPGGMYARFRELGLHPLTFVEELSARLPSPEERGRLRLPRGIAVIDTERIVSHLGTVLEVCLLLLSADQYRLTYSWTVE